MKEFQMRHTNLFQLIVAAVCLSACTTLPFATPTPYPIAIPAPPPPAPAPAPPAQSAPAVGEERKADEERSAKAPTQPAQEAKARRAQFVNGSAAYQIPPVMVEGKDSPVDLWIDAGVTVQGIRAQLRNYLIENLVRTAKRLGQDVENIKAQSIGTDIVAKSVLIGKKMFAELSGTGFDFDKTGPQEQAYIEGQPLQWSWLVTPKKAGDGLMLKLEVKADPGEGQTPVVAIRESVRVIARPRTLKERIEEIDLWVKLLTGSGLSALLALMYKRIRKPIDEKKS